MQELLAKIKGARAEHRCQLAVYVYTQVEPALEDLRRLIESAEKESNIAVFDYNLDEIEVVLKTLETLLLGLDSSEIKRIGENIERDYGESVGILKFYELLNPDGRSYTGDYGEFASRTFQLPSPEAISQRLTLQQMILYKQMEKHGLQPKLQITPMAFNIRTLGQKIDAKRADLKIINTSDTYVWEEIKDGELIYAPKSIKASPDGEEIVIGEGLSKSEWIELHGGFLVDIVPMKQNLEADSEIQNNSNAVQAEKYAAQLKERGLSPMGYESYLIAQMRALRSKSPLENGNYTLLLDSSLKMGQYIALGVWVDDCVYLFRDISHDGNDSLRIRASVRVL